MSESKRVKENADYILGEVPDSVTRSVTGDWWVSNRYRTQPHILIYNTYVSMQFYVRIKLPERKPDKKLNSLFIFFQRKNCFNNNYFLSHLMERNKSTSIMHEILYKSTWTRTIICSKFYFSAKNNPSEEKVWYCNIQRKQRNPWFFANWPLIMIYRNSPPMSTTFKCKLIFLDI